MAAISCGNGQIAKYRPTVVIDYLYNPIISFGLCRFLRITIRPRMVQLWSNTWKDVRSLFRFRLNVDDISKSINSISSTITLIYLPVRKSKQVKLNAAESAFGIHPWVLRSAQNCYMPLILFSWTFPIVGASFYVIRQMCMYRNVCKICKQLLLQKFTRFLRYPTIPINWPTIGFTWPY